MKFVRIGLLQFLSLVFMAVSVNAADGVHLFMLSGQSNMAGLNPDESFTPAVQEAFGQDNVIVIKDAVGGQPIRRWYKKWKSAEGETPAKNGDLYDRLLTQVNAEIDGKNIASMTFLWMQGERDAKEKQGTVYAASLTGLLDQLRVDLKRDDINVVIGRLSDFDMENKRYAHWTMLRKVQVEVAEAHPHGAWVDTDDLNDGLNRKGKPIKNDLHYSAEGYKTFGIADYRKYLDEPEGPGPFEHENTMYLDALIRTARYDEVLSTVDELNTKSGQLGWERTRTAQAQHAQGKTRSACKNLDLLVEQNDDDPQLHGQIALVYHRVGDVAKGRKILECAFPRGIFYEPRVESLREAFALSEEEWEAIAEGKADHQDLEQLARQWWLDPGALLRTSKRATPHCFGGDEFKLPNCKGCKHPIRQWFLLDIREIKGLAEQLPSWSLLPMLGCSDCMVWMGRHDYTVDLKRMQVKLNKVTLKRIKDFSKAFGKQKVIARQFVRLESLKPKKRPRAADIERYCETGPLVGGTPPWYQEPTELKCPTCKDTMVYVAAMYNTEGLDRYVPINNETGYQYHFACDKCLTLSVIAQWS